MDRGRQRSQAGGSVPDGRVGAPEPDEPARRVFGGRLDLARRYADLVAGDGVARGLVGPREVPRLWDRHLVNGAVLAALVPRAATVCDVGSGAGLPGIPLAIARPDLRVTLVEPLARRVAFLRDAVDELQLGTVAVLRGRVDGRAAAVLTADGTPVSAGPFDVVTGRAVAGLDRLLPWLAPLVRPGGVVLAVKGAAAGQEVTTAQEVLTGLGARARVVELGLSGDPTARVVRVDLPVPAVGRRGPARRTAPPTGRPS